MSRVDTPFRMPLVSPLTTRNPTALPTKDSRLINGYVEKDPTDGEYWIYKRLGIAPAPLYNSTSGSAFGPFGLWYGSGTVEAFWCKNGRLNLGGSVIEDLGGHPLALGGTTDYSFTTYGAFNSSVPFVFLHNSNYGYTIDSTLFAQAITDTNFVSFATSVGQGLVPGTAYLDGVVYVMDRLGNIWGSDIFNATVWQALNVIQANARSDNGVAIAQQLNYILALKQWSTQVYYDAGNPTGSALSEVKSYQLPYGCLYGESVSEIDSTLFWVTSNRTVSPQVLRLDNLTPRIVSTPAIERILDNVISVQSGNYSITPSTAYGWTLKHGGHRFYGLTVNTATITVTLVYDIDQTFWSIWTDPYGYAWPVKHISYIPPGTISGADSQGMHIAQLTDGSVWEIDGDYEYPTDKGIVFPVDIYTPNISFSSIRRKTLSGIYLETDIVPGSTLQSRYNDWDYDPAKWSNFRTTDLGVQKPRIDMEGTFDFRRAYNFRHSAPTAFRIKSAYLQVDEGVI